MDRSEIYREQIVNTIKQYHLTAQTDHGRVIVAPPYIINEAWISNPFMAGKGSPSDLQVRIDEKGHDPGIDSTDSLKEIARLNGVGVDCSRFVFEAANNMFGAIGAKTAASTFQIPTDRVAVQYEQGRWPLVDDERNVPPEFD